MDAEATPLTGVSPATRAFLADARKLGLFQKIDEKRQQVINGYFYTETSLADLASRRDISRERIRQLIVSGLAQMLDNAPFDTQERYLSEEVIRFKDI